MSTFKKTFIQIFSLLLLHNIYEKDNFVTILWIDQSGSIKSETAVESSVQCNLLETKVSLIYKNINVFMTDI